MKCWIELGNLKMMMKMGTDYRFYVRTKLFKKDKKTIEKLKRMIELYNHPYFKFDKKKGIKIINDSRYGDWHSFFKKIRKFLVGHIRVINLDRGDIIDYWFGDRQLKKSYPDYFIDIRQDCD